MTDGVVQAAVPGRGRGVLADVWGRSVARDTVMIVGAAAGVGVAAQLTLPVPGSPVPVTGQTFAVLLAGAALGPARGTASMLLYVVAGGLGVPWFAGGTAGWPTATMGYLLGFVLAAALVGRLAAAGADRRPTRALGMMAAGNALIYLTGVGWLAATTGMPLSRAVAVGVLPFLAGDLLKALLAAGLLPGSWRLVGRLSAGPDPTRASR
ncbi:biotin transporter BioY [Micromonospora halophytica]|uniref:Biotin transporter n=1 Tax=Micromonospora halophytica TaxID=47864 RepID=A0A1C5J6K0_9ACTN|nr:biotin transporter BioY [Micromonospora halophytica]SCG66204.1 biotin transport system substrate-specific component [Micromonospora halophytica]